MNENFCHVHNEVLPCDRCHLAHVEFRGRPCVCAICKRVRDERTAKAINENAARLAAATAPAKTASILVVARDSHGCVMGAAMRVDPTDNSSDADERRAQILEWMDAGHTITQDTGSVSVTGCTRAKRYNPDHFASLRPAAEAVNEMARDNDITVEDALEDWDCYAGGNDFEAYSGCFIEAYALGRGVDAVELVEELLGVEPAVTVFRPLVGDDDAEDDEDDGDEANP